MKELFKKTVHAVLEGGGPNDDPPYASYDDGPLSGVGLSESPRLVATYRLVSIRTLKKVHKIVTVKQRRRVKK